MQWDIDQMPRSLLLPFSSCFKRITEETKVFTYLKQIHDPSLLWLNCEDILFPNVGHGTLSPTPRLRGKVTSAVYVRETSWTCQRNWKKNPYHAKVKWQRQAGVCGKRFYCQSLWVREQAEPAETHRNRFQLFFNKMEIQKPPNVAECKCGKTVSHIPFVSKQFPRGGGK